MSGVPLGTCPTCGSSVREIADGVYGRENGTYRYRGQEFDCDCDTQVALRKHYLLAGIGDQYQRLDWNDFQGDSKVLDDVATFLDKWDSFKVNGMGVEFSSTHQGVGKTFGATHIAKELIKRGESVFFKPFLEIISLYDSPDKDELEYRLRTITVLILDEVVPPRTEAQGGLFSSKFEELIRHRTNFNLVTIMTTNLPPEKLNYHYPRTYSLLQAKQLRIEMVGDDVRQGRIANENLELVMNSEVRPLT
jgi:DNA replication protein DnaC